MNGLTIRLLFVVLVYPTLSLHVTRISNRQPQLPLKSNTVPEEHRPSEGARNDANFPHALDRTRRVLWKHLLLTASTVTMAPTVCEAGEIGARITKAVTTSDLGISVRTSVVKGAQVMDQLDGQWEKFSDRFGLGSERSKQGSRPQPKVIPDPGPLSVGTAQSILDASDRIFCQTTGIAPTELQTRIEKVANLVKVSFERAGVEFPTSSSPSSSTTAAILQFDSASRFNFVVYSRFKAYSELVVERSISFGPFRTDFEKRLGKELVTLILGKEASFQSSDKRSRLLAALSAVDDFLLLWKEKGLVALTERSVIDNDRITDWLEDIVDLEFTIALDGDVTLNSQVLLQEQGFRLYPNFCRYAISYLMNQVSPSDQKVSAMDYYFDTDYNSDPDKFEVKEVLLSVQLETI